MTPLEAYEKALAEGPSDETRRISWGCFGNEMWEIGPAIWYAIDVDQGPRDDTRIEACKNAKSAFLYANQVDGPRDDTREAASQDPEMAYWYAVLVDSRKTETTYNGVLHDPYWKEEYDRAFQDKRR